VVSCMVVSCIAVSPAISRTKRGTYFGHLLNSAPARRNCRWRNRQM
jgi:hypothetical protein